MKSCKIAFTTPFPKIIFATAILPFLQKGINRDAIYWYKWCTFYSILILIAVHYTAVFKYSCFQLFFEWSEPTSLLVIHVKAQQEKSNLTSVLKFVVWLILWQISWETSQWIRMNITIDHLLGKYTMTSDDWQTC